ncbi:hypothetical protein BDP27DRAFT_219727 [Rhodocollybia butyracea]|uniref:Uncharacterized protein n=1 Tax=Rhodocollybia butyracea TaxID=206335 RepID=A0A9P5UDE0_9AGAR|nr:hypothetical protein BDP27DRAFT_219727 [Rhodocollybia butyracea]
MPLVSRRNSCRTRPHQPGSLALRNYRARTSTVQNTAPLAGLLSLDLRLSHRHSRPSQTRMQTRLTLQPFCDSNTIFFKPDMAGTHDIAFSAFMLLDAIVSIAPATTAQTGGRIMPLNQWFHENLTKLLIRAWSSVQLIQAPFARLGAEILFSLITRSMDTTPATIDLIFHSLKATLQASDKELTHFLVGTISSLTNLDTRLDDISNGMHSLLYFHDNPSTHTEDCNPLQLSLAHGGIALACDVLRRLTPSARARQIAPRASNLQRLFCIGCFSSYLTLSFLKSPYWAMKALDQGLLVSVAKFLHLLEPGQLGGISLLWSLCFTCWRGLLFIAESV